MPSVADKPIMPSVIMLIIVAPPKGQQINQHFKNVLSVQVFFICNNKFA